MKKLTLLVAAFATILTVAPAAAHASEAQLRGTAPACVKRDVIKHRKYVKVTNSCTETMHLKVVIDLGSDSPCLTYQPGEQWEWTWGRGSYGKVVTC
ncbi:hypothetical protein OG349_01540 [Streptomyces sp. NBC_01317]|uniref:hypothetical protein n=1 Tax=Streptomyces sp. NBC_01317 TaxID=2903822 RepID=UPI002E0FC6D3|nr:hypothetical protein OG349_01540 [Streptomyces sp. NBC_01317]